MIIGNRERIIFTATAFNLLFEYSMRGINGLVRQPLLLPLLAIIYLTYFTLFEDVITRYRLRDYQVLIIGFIYGDLTALILPGGGFTPPLYLGINWGNLLYINIVWWGITQGILTFYLATRITPRDWGHKLLSWRGWIVSIILMTMIYLILRMYARGLPSTRSDAIAVIIIITLVLLAVLKKTVGGEASIPMYKPLRFMDVVTASTVIIFIVSAVFLTYGSTWVSIHLVNMPALRLVSIWTLLVGIIIVLYRILSRNPIPV